MIPKGFHTLKVKYWKKYMKKTPKMNKERKLKCKQVWGKQIKLNKQHSLDQYTQQLLYNTCNYCIYTVLRGSALFKGSKLCYLRNLTQVLVFSDKTTQMFSKQTKTEKQHKFINFYWSFLAFIDNIAQMAKIFVQLHGPRKELTINHSEIKRNPSATHQYCFIQHIQLLPNSEK